MSARVLLGVALALLWAACGEEPSAPDSVPAAGPPNVLLVVLDTARADAFSANGGPKGATPVFDRIAREGALFPDVRSTSGWTLPSHASIFTGLYPSRHGAHHESHLLREDQVTMAELLAATHDTAAFSENPHIVKAKGFAQGFGHFEETWRLRGARGEVPPTVEHAIAWLRAPERRGRPFFVFVNLMDPHLPYVPPERWQSALLPEGAAADTVGRMRAVSEREARLFMTGKLRFSETELEVLRALYRAEVAFADDRFGRILDVLEEDGALDRTLVLALSDHGENIGEHGLMEHQLCLYETLLRVPLAMRLPGVFEAGSRRPGPVQLVDLLPTVLDVLGVPEGSRPAVEGTSLLDADPEPGRPVYAEYMRPLRQRARFEAVNPEFDFDRFDRRLKSLQVLDLKLIVSDRGETELYDLAADPGETRDLSGEMPGVVQTLRAHLERWSASARPEAARPAPALDPETIEALRELGYVE